MIFITVGTHEQGMERLLMEVDRLIKVNLISNDVFAQIGYSNYTPKYFGYKKMIEYDEMIKNVEKSKIIITHGGPGSIFLAIHYGKVPIVVPRNPEFGEHVDNHQILFAKFLETKSKIIAVYDIKELYEKIKNYILLSQKCKINLDSKSDFIYRFSNEINNIMNIK